MADQSRDLIAQILAQGGGVPMQAHSMGDGNEMTGRQTPYASGRAEPTWGPVEAVGMGMFGGAGALGANVSSRLLARGAGGRATEPGNIGLHRVLQGLGGTMGAGLGLYLSPDVKMDLQQRHMPQGFNPQVPPDAYAQGAYEDGTMYGADATPAQLPGRRLPPQGF